MPHVRMSPLLLALLKAAQKFAWDEAAFAGFPPEKNLWGGGHLENTDLLKKGICLLNTFLKDFTKMPIKKNTVLQFDGGISPPLRKS